MYLLDEILELARQSPESAQGVADSIEKKLGHKSPVVKFKVLVLFILSTVVWSILEGTSDGSACRRLSD